MICWNIGRISSQHLIYLVFCIWSSDLAREDREYARTTSRSVFPNLVYSEELPTRAKWNVTPCIWQGVCYFVVFTLYGQICVF